MKSSRSLDKLFDEAHDDLAILITRTRQLRRWTGIFRAQLDADLAPHVYLGNMDESSLTVYVDSAAWATRLRFQVPQLLPLLRQTNPTFKKLVNIQVKVLTPSGPEPTQPSHTTGPTMNRENANGINALSNSVDDPDLQQALQRLARHASDQK